MKPSCQQIEKLLPAFADAELDEPNTLVVEQHLSQCVHCRQQLELQEQCWEALSLLEEEQLEPSSMIRARVWEEIRRTPVQKPWWERFGFRLPAAAATLVLGFWIGVSFVAPPSVNSQDLAQTPPPLDREMVALASDPGYSLELIPDPASYQPLDEEFRVALNAPPVGDLDDTWFSVSDDFYHGGDIQLTNFEE